MSIVHMRAFVLLLVIGCSASPRAPSVATREEPAATCGNGIVEDGEACDPNVIWERRCPEPWGMCWSCSSACTLVPAFTEEVESIPQDVFCTQKTYGPPLTRTYDARGNVLTQVDDTTPWRYTFLRDETGAMTGLDIDYRYNGTDHHPRQRYTLDDKHRRIRFVDEAEDPQRVWHYDYTPDGMRQRTWGGTVVNGIPEAEYRYTYDAEHRLIAQITSFRDVTWHHTTTFAYDQLGREVSYVTGMTKDSAVPSIDCRTTYDATGSQRCCRIQPKTVACTTRDTRGETTRMTYDDGINPPTFTRHENEYDRRGLLVRSTVINQDGSISRVERSRYDKRGLLVGRTHQAPGGSAEPWLTRTYDCLEGVFDAMPRRGFVERR